MTSSKYTKLLMDLINEQTFPKFINASSRGYNLKIQDEFLSDCLG